MLAASTPYIGDNTMHAQSLWECCSEDDMHGKPIAFFVANKGDVICLSEPNCYLIEQRNNMEKIANALNLVDALAALKLG